MHQLLYIRVAVGT